MAVECTDERYDFNEFQRLMEVAVYDGVVTSPGDCVEAAEQLATAVGCLHEQWARRLDGRGEDAEMFCESCSASPEFVLLTRHPAELSCGHDMRTEQDFSSLWGHFDEARDGSVHCAWLRAEEVEAARIGGTESCGQERPF